MSRVITFSRTFPSYHPRKGEPTYFVEKIIKSFQSLGYDRIDMPDSLDFDLGMYHICDPKHHTIRAGHRWKVGDWFSPRVWSGKPYNSKQIIIAPDIQIKEVWNFEIKDGWAYLNDGKGVSQSLFADIANNDGLTPFGLKAWLKYPKSTGEMQIICWNENINY